MVAGRAGFGSLIADHYMTAVSAFPYLDLTLFENSGCLDVFKKRTVAFFMMFFDCCYTAEF
jgi:hypothetical protein